MSNSKPSREERRHIAQSQPQLYRHLVDLLARRDPIGLVAIGCPRDEYDPEASTILARMGEADSAEDLQTIVHEEFVSWFFEEIAGPRSHYEGVAREAWELAKEFPGARPDAG